MCGLLVCTVESVLLCTLFCGECVQSVWRSIVQCVERERDSAAPAAGAAEGEPVRLRGLKIAPQAAPASLTQPRAGVP